MSTRLILAIFMACMLYATGLAQQAVLDTSISGIKLALTNGTGRHVTLAVDDTCSSMTFGDSTDNPLMGFMVKLPDDYDDDDDYEFYHDYDALDYSNSIFHGTNAGIPYIGLTHIFSNQQRHFYKNIAGDTLEVVITPGEHKMEVKGEVATGQLTVRDRLDFECGPLLTPLPGGSLIGYENRTELRRAALFDKSIVLGVKSDTPTIYLGIDPGTLVEFDLSVPGRVVQHNSHNGIPLCGPIYDNESITFTLPTQSSKPQMRYLFKDSLHHFWIDENGDTLLVVITPGEQKITMDADLEVKEIQVKDKIGLQCAEAPSEEIELFCTPLEKGLRTCDAPDEMKYLMDCSEDRHTFTGPGDQRFHCDMSGPGIEFRHESSGGLLISDTWSQQGRHLVLPPSNPSPEMRLVFKDSLHHIWVDENGDTLKVVVTPGEHKMSMDADLEVKEMEVQDVLRVVGVNPSPSLHNTQIFTSPSSGGLLLEHPTEQDLKLELIPSVGLSLSNELHEIIWQTNHAERVGLLPSYNSTPLPGLAFEPDEIHFSFPNSESRSQVRYIFSDEVSHYYLNANGDTIQVQFAPTESEMRYLFKDDFHHIWEDENGDTIKVVITPGEHKLSMEAGLEVDGLEVESELRVFCPPSSPSLHDTRLFCGPTNGGIKFGDPIVSSGIRFEATEQRVVFEGSSGGEVRFDIPTSDEFSLNPSFYGVPMTGTTLSENGVRFNFPSGTTKSEMRYHFDNDLQELWINSLGDSIQLAMDPSQAKFLFGASIEVENRIDAKNGVFFPCPSNPLCDAAIEWDGGVIDFRATGFTAQQVLRFDPITDTIRLSTGTVNGVVKVEGDLHVTGTKAFQIDHPLDPENKFLVHSCVEAPERLNIYSGTTMTDEKGFATVQLPEYFNALNVDHRYQLTTIGKTFAQAIIWEEINELGEFVIRTEEPNVKVSWQVSGARNDKYARENPIVVEVDKR